MRDAQVISGYLFSLLSLPLFLVFFFASFLETIARYHGQADSMLFTVLAIGIPCAGFCSYILANRIFENQETSHVVRVVILGVLAVLWAQYLQIWSFSELPPFIDVVGLYSLFGLIVCLPLKPRPSAGNGRRLMPWLTRWRAKTRRWMPSSRWK